MNKNHILHSLYRANQMASSLPKDVLDIAGFCPPKIRHFLNNLCDFPACNYVEVGTYQGASLISASYGNSGKFLGIDNFSEFDGPRVALKQNLAIHGKGSAVSFLEKDCWDVTLDELPRKVNVYFYDGNHSYESQKRGLSQFDPMLADEFILLVDDYSWSDSTRGTRDALDELGYQIDMKVEMHDDGNAQGWWNGLLIMLAKRGK